MEDVLIAAVEAPRWSAAKWTVDGASRQPGFKGNLINGQRHAGDFERFGQRGKYNRITINQMSTSSLALANIHYVKHKPVQPIIGSCKPQK